MIWKLLLIVSQLYMVFGATHQIVYGAVKQGDSYYVKPILPANNQGNETSYYNLLMKANTFQTLQLEIVNNTGTDKSFNIENVDSRTMADGTIGYDNRPDKGSAKRSRFTNMVGKIEPVSVSSRTKKIVEIIVKTPTEEFDGIILGGIRVTERQADQQTGGVSNVFSYIVPVKIQETNKVFPNQLIFQGIEVNQRNNESFLTISLENINPSIINELSLQIKVAKENSLKQLNSKALKSVQIAPNSIFSHIISLGETLEAGNYQVELHGTAQDLNKTWQAGFTIEQAQTQKPIESFFLTNKSYRWQNLVIVALLMVSVVSLFFTIWRRSQSNSLSKKSYKRRKNEK